MAIQRRNDEQVDLLSADFLRSTMPQMVHNGIGGYMEGAIEVGDDTVLLISSTSPAVVTKRLRYTVVVAAGDDSSESSGSAVPNSLSELFNAGDNILELRVTAGGAVSILRTTGTATIKVKFRFDWV